MVGLSDEQKLLISLWGRYVFDVSASKNSYIKRGKERVGQTTPRALESDHRVDQLGCLRFLLRVSILLIHSSSTIACADCDAPVIKA